MLNTSFRNILGISNNTSILSIGACFLVFFAGPFGALLRFINLSDSYLIRFSLIFFAFLLSIIAIYYRSKRILPAYNKLNIAIVLIYVIAILFSSLQNTESKVYSFLQIGGIVGFILTGIFIGSSVNNKEESVLNITLGYLLANFVWGLIIAAFLMYRFNENFNIENGRFIGLFVGSTAVSEIFFASMLIGVLLLYFGFNLIGILLLSASVLAIYWTGIRSGFVISIIALMVMVFKAYLKNKKVKYIHNNVFVMALVSLLLSAILIIFKGSEIAERFSIDNIYNEGRIQIWLYGLEILTQGSYFFGKGIRAEFLTDLEIYENYNQIAVAWHNTWLGILIETGIIGLLSFSLIIGVAIRNIYKTYIGNIKFNSVDSIFLVTTLLICIRYFIMSFTEMNLYTALSPGVMFICIMFGALSVCNLHRV